MLQFIKMHGLGNDFVVIDGVRQNVSLSPDLVRRIADRHFGIGCDQVLLVAPPIREGADFSYRIFNADGSEVNQCGNGARCFARFVYEQGLCEKYEVRVDTGAGQLLLRRNADGNITVDMGIPRHAPGEVPLLAERESRSYRVQALERDWEFAAVSLGNPHAVLLVESVETAPVAALGPVLEHAPVFPERANIGFMEVVDPHRIRLRVFERGSGETLACGSGACAAAVAGIEWGLLESPVQVDLPGGTLSIQWSGRGAAVLMTGPATTVFEGKMQL